MKTVMIRGLEIGAGKPKICVPVTGRTEKEIIETAQSFADITSDMVEWRADWFDSVFEAEKVMDILNQLRDILGEIPLLFTFRTAEEGGEKSIGTEAYSKLNLLAAESGLVDLVDIELFRPSGQAAVLVDKIHETGTKVVLSNHDFAKTPAQNTIIERLQRMQELGGDICKIAVMPQSEMDVLTLLMATREMNDKFADRPVVTMSMGGIGVVSRISGEIFGSAVTFGAAGRASAPGQIGTEELSQILDVMHKSK